MVSNKDSFSMPMRWVGPVLVGCGTQGDKSVRSVLLPLVTFETPLWPSVGRGAKVSQKIGGITSLIIKDSMTRSVVLSTGSAYKAKHIVNEWKKDLQIQEEAEKTSKFVKLDSWQAKIIGRNIYLRLSFYTAEASGHNMVTKASDAVMRYLEQSYDLAYVSVSGNYCVDKKVSAVNSIMGRGKEIIVEGVVPEDICKKYLKTTPEKIHTINTKKNYLGSIISGSTCSANAHYANILLALYLATGQDAANIVEGSQGITYTEIDKGALYFSVNIPNIIVGAIGNGKRHPQVKKNLEKLGCLQPLANTNYTNSQHLAMLIGAAVWCGEISLLAAQTNPEELMRSHLHLERNGN